MTSEDRPLWALAVLTLVVIEPALRVAYPGVLPVPAAAEFAAVASAQPTAAYIGLVVAHGVILLLGYGVWRMLSAFRVRTLIPTVFAMIGGALVAIRFAAIGGLV